MSYSFCDPIDCSFSVHGIPQARILEWVAISFSRGSSWPRDQTRVSCIGRWILYHWVTKEVPGEHIRIYIFCYSILKNISQQCIGQVIKSFIQKTIAIFRSLVQNSFNNCLTSQKASLVAQRLKHLPPMRETQVRSLGREDPLEKEMATHSSILAWKISWMEELGWLLSMGSQRVGPNWATELNWKGTKEDLHK